MFAEVIKEPTHLRLLPTAALQRDFDSTLLAGIWRRWLEKVEGISQVQVEQGLDLIELRFYFADEIFYGHYEHYTDSFWLDTDSSPAVMLLSDLAQSLQKHIEQTIEFI